LQDGRILGQYDGKGDLEIFLAKFENTSKMCGWGDVERAYFLKNSLTGAAGTILIEVGQEGTFDQVYSKLVARHVKGLEVDQYRAEMMNRKRRHGESLKDYYLALCSLKIGGYSNSEQIFPEIYFRDIFVNNLDDRDLRKQVLIQKPLTMEAAYQVASGLETIDSHDPTSAYEPPSRTRTRVRVIEQEPESPAIHVSSHHRDDTTAMARTVEDLKDALKNLEEKVRTERQP